MMDYVGDNIQFEEMPQGCVISNLGGGEIHSVVISSTADAVAVIQTLEKMLNCQLGMDVYKKENLFDFI